MFRNVASINESLYETKEQYLIASSSGRPYRSYKTFIINNHIIIVFGGENIKCKVLVININRDDVQSCSNSVIDVEELSFKHITFHQINKRVFVIANKGSI